MSEEMTLRVVRRVTWTGLVVNLILSALKFAGGVVGRSQAVVADAVHSVSDATTDVAILVGSQYWTKPADATHPHGHRRVETLVTIAIGMVLVVVATGLLWNAVATLRQPHESPPGPVALFATLVSILAKEILYRWTVAAGRRVRSMPLIANAWHHRSDAFSSVPALLAVGGAMIHPAWYFLDHVGAVVISLFIYHAAFKIVFPEMGKLVDSAAPQETTAQIRGICLETAGVKHVHRIRTRYVGSSRIAVDLHIKVEPSVSVRVGHEISEKVKEQLLLRGPDIADVVVHLEPYDPAPRAGGTSPGP
jgi:cation diffusion facilitator family transporter